jgi:dephospho-CoA kinase
MVSVTHIGLTGGIGSGKSTVAAFLATRGAHIIDADAISKSVTASGGAAMPAIEAAFGITVITAEGALDRFKMRERIFTDPEARHRLEAIVHPLVGEGVREAARWAIDKGFVCVVYDIPLLVESRYWRQQLDQILVVDCSEATQIRRVKERNGLQEQEIRAILGAQAPRLKRLAAADHVLCNDGITLAQLAHLVQQIGGEFGL